MAGPGLEIYDPASGGAFSARGPAGNLSIARLAGEFAQFGRLGAGSIADYVAITTLTTTVVKNTPGVFYGVLVVTGAATGTVTVYDNASAASGTKLIDGASVATSGTFIPVMAGGGVLTKNGVVVVSATAVGLIIPLFA